MGYMPHLFCGGYFGTGTVALHQETLTFDAEISRYIIQGSNHCVNMDKRTDGVTSVKP